jgi:hypothetical protein
MPAPAPRTPASSRTRWPRCEIEASRSAGPAERNVTKAKLVRVDAATSDRVFGQVPAEVAPFLDEQSA